MWQHKFRELLKTVVWRMPYDVRRTFYSRLRSEAFGELQRRRTGESDIKSSLEPFLQHRCIFIHIPKAAGTSVKTVLFGGPVGGHLRAHEYQIAFTRNEFATFFKFTFVRNPWARVKSAYEFLKRGGMTVDDRQLWDRYLSGYRDFEDFVCSWINQGNVHRLLLFQPQYSFICLPGTSRPIVDFIGSVERMDTDLAVVQRRLGMTPTAAVIANNNPRGQSDWRAGFTPTMVDAIAHAYATDIRLFGYSFDTDEPAPIAVQTTNELAS